MGSEPGRYLGQKVPPSPSLQRRIAGNTAVREHGFLAASSHRSFRDVHVSTGSGRMSHSGHSKAPVEDVLKGNAHH